VIHLLFAVHNHQPVGNFDFIFERAFDRAYKPFLEVLKRHPRVRLSLHFSGILLDWLEAHRPGYLAEVRALCEAGQLEVLGGGYYEPILPMLTEADRLGQVEALSRRVEALFGARPRGMWLAERVWEPSLVSSIADAGIEYVVLDGSHFKMVGKSESDLDGYFETEDQGRRLKLLPIHDVIRDYIPFRPVEEVVAALRDLNTEPDKKGAAGGGRVQVVFGDDGEKFGDWPQTFDTVYTQGWLDRFFTAMEAEPETFAVRPLREGVDLGKSLGLVYLPPASYQEMMVWAQNPADIPRFRSVRQMLWDAGRGDDAERFVRGTFWRNFLVKYPESNRIHKQALRLSRALDGAKLPAAAGREARNHVWQAQCNCGYWHGVFGGLYLPHLRFALYRQLIAAQKLLDAKVLGRKPASWEKTDWNFDGRAEHLLNTRGFLIAFTADGAVDQLWLKRTEINLCDTLTRRREAYHAHIVSGSGGGTKLEDQIGAKEEGLESFLIYDRRLRENFSEWLLPADAYRAQAFAPLAPLAFGEPVFTARRGRAEVRFEAVAPLPEGRLEMVKTFTAAPDGASLEVRWSLRARDGGARFRFVAETLFCLLAGNAPDRYVLWDEDGPEAGAKNKVVRRDILASHGIMPGGTAVTLADEWLGFRAVVASAKGMAPSAIWRDALETVSQSEGGYERVYQGTVIAPVWDVSLADGDAVEFGLRIDFEEGMGHAQQTA
jgi:hypothetical protein